MRTEIHFRFTEELIIHKTILSNYIYLIGGIRYLREREIKGDIKTRKLISTYIRRKLKAEFADSDSCVYFGLRDSDEMALKYAKRPHGEICFTSHQATFAIYEKRKK